MGMDDPVFRMLPKQCAQLPAVNGQVRRGHGTETVNPAPEIKNLFVIIPRFPPVGQKIKLHPLAVNPPVEVHQKSFRARAVHFSDHLQNTKRLQHMFFLLPGAMCFLTRKDPAVSFQIKRPAFAPSNLPLLIIQHRVLKLRDKSL